MTHVGGALPALVLGLEPIVIGLVGSLVVREHVGGRLALAFAIGLVGEAVIAGFVRRAPASGRCCRSPRSPASSRSSRPTASRCASWRRCRRRRSSAWRRSAAPSRCCRSSAVESRAATPCRRSTRAGRGARLRRGRRGRPRLAGLGGGALACARGRGGARPLPGSDRRGARIPRRPGRAALRPPRRRRGDRDRGDRARPPRLDWVAMRRYNVTTFGCQMNVHDSERIKGLLESLGLGEATDAGGGRRGRVQHLHDPREGRRALPRAPDGRARGQGARSRPR